MQSRAENAIFEWDLPGCLCPGRGSCGVEDDGVTWTGLWDRGVPR